jgi:aminopeptidase N
MGLVVVRGLIDSASRAGDISGLRSWLASGQLAAGLDLDSRLRWQILLRLTVLGAIGAAELDREASADITAAGRLSAARCRAAIGAETAKQAAWTAMFDDRSGAESGYQLTAIAQGFWQPDQAELLAGYVPRYFPALVEVAVRRGPEVARVLCQHGFPHHAADAATLRAAQECLEGGGLTGSLARLLADQVEDLRRSAGLRSAS